jgi:hypothetical protein
MVLFPETPDPILREIQGINGRERLPASRRTVYPVGRMATFGLVHGAAPAQPAARC